MAVCAQCIIRVDVQFWFLEVFVSYHDLSEDKETIPSL